MKPNQIVTILLVFLLVLFTQACDPSSNGGCGENNETPPAKTPTELEGVARYTQSTIRIERELTIYFDPFRFADEPHDADVIFLTHSHFDHFSADDMAKVAKEDTLIVAPEEMEQSIRDLGYSDITTVTPGSNYTIKGLAVEATFAYNPGAMARHAKSHNWVGYVVTMGETRYYIAGDTNFVPEMESVSADVAFLPVGGGSSMDAEEAAQAAAAIGVDIAVPIHYGVTAGSMDDAEHFVELLDEGIAGYIYSDDGELQ
jgi:L-ascorbate metabolism protein UlaG (beta-lactamase superfamily)